MNAAQTLIDNTLHTERIARATIVEHISNDRVRVRCDSGSQDMIDCDVLDSLENLGPGG